MAEWSNKFISFCFRIVFRYDL